MTFALLVLLLWCRAADTPHQLLPAVIPESQRPLGAVRCRQLLGRAEVDDRLLEAALVRLARLCDTTPARLWLQLSHERLQETSQHRQLADNLLRLVRTTADHWLQARLSQLANQWQTSSGQTSSEQTGDGLILAADFLLRAERSSLCRMLGQRDRFGAHQWPAVLSAVRLVPLDRLSAGRRQQLARLTLACVRSDRSRPGLPLLARLPVSAVARQRGAGIAARPGGVVAGGCGGIGIPCAPADADDAGLLALCRRHGCRKEATAGGPAAGAGPPAGAASG